ncbi:hypothetical protein DFH09DRAFT_1099823 [Mycena vulgaris]|nr:hypothetical protein DFH09DRAFT_1099823 [Mycena vulgaris]
MLDTAMGRLRLRLRPGQQARSIATRPRLTPRWRTAGSSRARGPTAKEVLFACACLHSPDPCVRRSQDCMQALPDCSLAVTRGTHAALRCTIAALGPDKFRDGLKRGTVAWTASGPCQGMRSMVVAEGAGFRCLDLEIQSWNNNGTVLQPFAVPKARTENYRFGQILILATELPITL